MKARHAHLPKYNIGTHFLTAKTFKNTPYLRDLRCARILCEELESARDRYGFYVFAFVVMPDHIHLLLWWDAEAHPDLSISKVAWAVKGKSARRIVDYFNGPRVGGGSALTHPRVGGVGEGNALAYPGATLRPARGPEDKPHRRNWRYQIWQPGAGYDFNIYTEHKLLEKIAYIHANPVRAGLVETPEQYPWSSAANYAGQPGAHPVAITAYAEMFA